MPKTKKDKLNVTRSDVLTSRLRTLAARRQSKVENKLLGPIRELKKQINDSKLNDQEKASVLTKVLKKSGITASFKQASYPYGYLLPSMKTKYCLYLEDLYRRAICKEEKIKSALRAWESQMEFRLESLTTRLCCSTTWEDLEESIRELLNYPEPKIGAVGRIDHLVNDFTKKASVLKKEVMS